jgi:hypothetical protein
MSESSKRKESVADQNKQHGIATRCVSRALAFFSRNQTGNGSKVTLTNCVRSLSFCFLTTTKLLIH